MGRSGYVVIKKKVHEPVENTTKFPDYKYIETLRVNFNDSINNKKRPKMVKDLANILEKK